MKLFALVCAALPVLVFGGLSAGASPGAVNGRIAFERTGFIGGSEVWTMDQDGSDLRRVGSGSDPSWSPDGSNLVVVDGDGKLAVIGADGVLVRVLNVTGVPPYGVVHPAWSPDGSTIAFGGSDGLYVVSAAGGPARKLAAGYESAPAWSPDGSQIAFIGSDATVAVINSDGSGLRALVGARGASGGGVSWSPDGARIAYGDSETGGISTVPAHGGPSSVLTPYLGVAQSANPAWSPDGRRIAFVDNGTDICIANTDGTALGRLTYAPYDEVTGRTGASNRDPAWQPLRPGSAPAGSLTTPVSPATDWDRNLSWSWACSLQYKGRALSGVVGTPRARIGDLVTYRIRLANRGEVAIGEASLAAFGATLDGGVRLVSINATQGACHAMPSGGSERPLLEIDCKFGSLFPGETAVATLRVRPAAPGELEFMGGLPQPLDSGGGNGGTDASEPDLLMRTPVAGCTQRGTDENDVISGTNGNDVICGLAGNDRISGRGGRDRLFGGSGDDTIVVRDREVDHVSCGSGEDAVVADRLDRIGRDCEHIVARHQLR